MAHPPATATSVGCVLAALALAHDGYLRQGGRVLFPVGSYELPREEAALRDLAQAGFNLVRCHNAADLDRAHGAGLQGWAPLPLQLGPDDERLRRVVESVREHPAPAV